MFVYSVILIFHNSYFILSSCPLFLSFTPYHIRLRLRIFYFFLFYSVISPFIYPIILIFYLHWLIYLCYCYFLYLAYISFGFGSTFSVFSCCIRLFFPFICLYHSCHLSPLSCSPSYLLSPLSHSYFIRLWLHFLCFRLFYFFSSPICPYHPYFLSPLPCLSFYYHSFILFWLIL